MNNTYDDFKQATKLDICQKFIQEADRVSQLMSVIKTYCQQTINSTYSDKVINLDDFLTHIIQPTIEDIKANNDFIQIEQIDTILIEILRDWDKIVFPQENPQEPKQDNTQPAQEPKQETTQTEQPNQEPKQGFTEDDVQMLVCVCRVLRTLMV